MTSFEMRANPRFIKAGDKTYELHFDLLAMSLAEQVYITYYQRDVNAAVVVAEMHGGKMSAFCAITYGAIISAGAKVTWADFAKNIMTLDNFDTIFPEVEAGINDFFGVKPDDEIEPVGEIKN